MAPQRASDLSVPRGRSGDELARGALVSLYACSLRGLSLVDYDQVLGGTWESRDSLTGLEACLCAPHILFLMMSGEELSELTARTIKHFVFRSDLVLSIHLLSQAPASLAMKHSAVWSEHPVSRPRVCLSFGAGHSSKGSSLPGCLFSKGHEFWAFRSDGGAKVPTRENRCIEVTRQFQK